MIKKLPTFKGYTVDVRVGEFRKIPFDGNGDEEWEWIDFDSEEGDKLLCELLATLPKTSKLFKEIADKIL